MVMKEMLPKLVQWYHKVMNHAKGMDRLEESIKRHFYHCDLREEVRKVMQECDICQKMKCGGRQYGEMTAREALTSPWQEVHVDLIGPWNIKLNGQKLQFLALCWAIMTRRAFGSKNLLALGSTTRQK